MGKAAVCKTVLRWFDSSTGLHLLRRHVVMSEVNASEIVIFLLEDRPRVCAGCQAEHGVTATNGETHGWCYRHALEAWTRDLFHGDGDAAKAYLSQKPASFFSPDMRQAAPA